MKYYLLLLLLFMPLMVSASDSTLKIISNCYNVTVDVELSSGNYTDVSFNDCSKSGRYHFDCKCRDYTQPFKLVMKTDSKYAERFYKLDIEYNTYQLTTYNGVKIVKDRGTFSTITGYMDEGKENIITQPVYIENNNTIIVEKIINVSQPIYIDSPVYFENTSKLDDLSLSYALLKNENSYLRTSGNDLFKEYRLYRRLFLSVCLISLILLMLIIVQYKRFSK